MITPNKAQAAGMVPIWHDPLATPTIRTEKVLAYLIKKGVKADVVAVARVSRGGIRKELREIWRGPDFFDRLLIKDGGSYRKTTYQWRAKAKPYSKDNPQGWL